MLTLTDVADEHSLVDMSQVQPYLVASDLAVNAGSP